MNRKNILMKNIILTLCLSSLVISQCDETNWEIWFPELDGCQLDSLNFDGTDFSYASLNDADLSYSNLSSCNFTEASLINANLSNANTWNTIFEGAYMCGVDLSGLDYTGSPITEADCFDVCGGEAELDECGVCDGDGTACFGCTDPFALNYSEYAIYDDGSCEYFDGEISGDPPSTIWTHYLHDSDSPFENDVPTSNYTFGVYYNPKFNCVESFNDGVTCSGEYHSAGNYNMDGYCNSGEYTGFIYELDIEGNMLWFKEFGRWNSSGDIDCGNAHNYVFGLIKGSDGYYSYGYNIKDYNKAYILKLNPEGNREWLKFKDLNDDVTDEDWIYNGMEASNGNLVFVGRSYLEGYHYDATIWIMDSDGNDINSFSYHLEQYDGSNSEQESLYDVIETGDGSYVAVGNGLVRGVASDAYYPLIIKFNEDGIIYAKHLIEDPFAWVQDYLSVLELDNGNLLLTGTSNPGYALIIQANSEGDFISYGMDHLSFELSTGDSRFFDAIHTIDNKLMLFGWAQNSFQSNDFLTVKMDQQMNIEWMAYDGDVFNQADYGHGIVQLSDNTIVTSGVGKTNTQTEWVPIVIRKHFQDGCTDPVGCNFNPYASNDNGSCYYEDICDVCDGNGFDFCDDDGDGVNNYDQWGYGPYNISVNDVPEDQGGRVYIDFHRSFYDSDSLRDVEVYTVERLDGETWVGVLTQSAYGADEYTVEVSTLSDDTETEFRVIANMDEGNFLALETVTGTSEDNIAPGVPEDLTGSFGDGDVTLNWSEPEDEDFQYFNIYRDNESHDQIVDNTYVDIDVPSTDYLIYNLTAVDYSGNESEFSETYSVEVHLMGDMDDNFELNVIDVVILIEYILEINQDIDTTYADMNGDGAIDVIDIVMLVEVILSLNEVEGETGGNNE